MQKITRKLGLIVVTLATIFASISTITPQAKAYACDDLKIIFARGSGEELSGPSETAWRESIMKYLEKSTLKYEFYELGSQKQEGFQYRAVPVSGSVDGIINALGAFASAGDAFEFGESMIEGSSSLKAYVKKVSSMCPQTKFIIGGYSQGAMLITRILADLPVEKIIYTATFGDPKIYLPEGRGLIPAACYGQNLSEYRTYVPDCHAYKGLLGSNQPYQPSGFSGKLGTWCNDRDFLCSSKWDVGNHSEYIADGHYASAAKVIAKKLRAAFPSKFTNSPAPVTRTTHDVAILIDSTFSMDPMIERYKNEARKLARQTLAGGGRVALYEYRDLDDPFETAQLCDFGCSLEDFERELNAITTGGGGDTSESVMSASLKIMNELKWKRGANKSVVVLTDSTYHNPDRDGTTLDQVVQRSLEIDPVNFYIVTKKDMVPMYRELTERTNGRVFDIERELELSTPTILGRPVAALALENYEGLTWQEFSFDASESYAVNGQIGQLGEAVADEMARLEFDWDLDGDGVFEITNGGAKVQKVYQQEFSGFVQVKVRMETGAESTMSAKVNVRNEAPARTQIFEANSQAISASAAQLNFTTDAARVVVIVNDAILGYLDLRDGQNTSNRQTSLNSRSVKLSQNLVLNNLKGTSEVALVPYDNNGRRGEAKNLTILPVVPGAPNTGTLNISLGVNLPGSLTSGWSLAVGF